MSGSALDLAKSIIFATVAQKQSQIVRDVSTQLRAAIEVARESFFRRMGEAMDKPQSPEGVPAWRPLSHFYARHKGTDNFWNYTTARRALNARLRRKRRSTDRRRIVKVANRETLRVWTKKQDPLKIFGPVKVERVTKDADGRPNTATVVSRFTPNFGKTGAPLALRTGRGGYSAEDSGRLPAGVVPRVLNRIAIRILPWSGLRDGEPPEQLLLRRGTTSTARTGKRSGRSAQVTKLVGKAAWHRPFMKPLMNHYATRVFDTSVKGAVKGMNLSESALSTNLVREARVMNLSTFQDLMERARGRR